MPKKSRRDCTFIPHSDIYIYLLIGIVFMHVFWHVLSVRKEIKESQKVTILLCTHLTELN